MLSPQQNIQKGMQGSRDSGEFKKLKWVLQQRKPGHPNKRWGHTSIIHEGKLLIIGGKLTGGNREGVHRVNCQTLENSPLSFPVQPQVRQSHSCVARQDSLYVYGGCVGSEVIFFNSTFLKRQLFSHNKFHVTNDLLQIKVSGLASTWRKIEQKKPISPREKGRYMLVYGGNSADDTQFDEFWLLDLETFSWLPVEHISGRIQAKIGVTMNVIGQYIYAFGGEWGEGNDSHYSNDLSRLSFEGEFRSSAAPSLNIQLIESSGLKPPARTGHASIDYKGRMLIIIGGEGSSSRNLSTLFNDVWTFDLRNQTWSELLIENKTIFRPRSNFTANLYKNTIYVFGGFVNLENFKCTDELFTLTLIENRQNLRQQIQHRNSIAPTHPSQQLYCNQCRFEFLSQARPKIAVQRPVSNNNLLYSSTQNILYAAKLIVSPLEALGLVVDSISRIRAKKHKNMKVELFVETSSKNKDVVLNGLLEKAHLSICVQGTSLNKEELQELTFSYRCDCGDPGFDLKNGLFRLGKEVLICQLFEDGMVRGYLLTPQGILGYALHLQALPFELQRHENQILSQYLGHNGISLASLQPSHLYIFVGALIRRENGSLELQKQKGTDYLVAVTSDPPRSFEDFIREYFLTEKQISLLVHNHPVELVPYEQNLRAEGTEREQQPTTNFFSKVHLIVNEHPDLIGPKSAFIKLFALGRRVGVFNKFPFISGFIELSDSSALNFPRSRCESHEVRMALQEEIRVLLEECKKRESQVPVYDLEKEAAQ